MDAAPPTVAIAYDFDGTLAPGNMQEHSFIPKLPYTKADFWKKVDQLSEQHNMDKILAYMYTMVQEAEKNNVRSCREDLVRHGASIPLFSGVEQWFDAINDYGHRQGVRVQHFIISSGLREMIEGTKIFGRFTEVFASHFLYDNNAAPIWPALAINYTAKTQYLFRINKQAYEVWDDETINAYLPDDRRPVPFSNIVYIGDGATDIPAMKMVTYQGGHAIAVYPPDQPEGRRKAAALARQGRARYMAGADYRAGGALQALVRNLINIIAARHEHRKVPGRAAARRS